ncbi:MAG: hypothetical protein KDD48_06135 [Bdellovibrionales bacterium]|nr:hypothetical protein [Bdellovibrionales bacterium]
MKLRSTIKHILTVSGIILVTAQCGREGFGTNELPFLGYPFQVVDSQPTFERSYVNPGTSEVTVFFNEPVDFNTAPFNYVLEEARGASVKDITNRVSQIIPYPAMNALIFKLSVDPSTNNYLNSFANYTLTLYPGIQSTTGEYLAYIADVTFSTADFNTIAFGYASIIKDGPPTVVSIDRELRCGCLIVRATFSETLAQSPRFNVELDTIGLLAWFYTGSSGSITAYPSSYDRTEWSVSLGCVAANQAWDRVVKVKIQENTVYDLEGKRLANNAPNSYKVFRNKLFYSCGP